jgi:hypothetical protein
MYLVQSVLFDKSKFSLHLSKEWLKHHHYHHVDVDDKPNTYRFRQVSPKEAKKQGYTNFKTKKLGKSGVSLVLAYNECGGSLMNDEHIKSDTYNPFTEHKPDVLKRIGDEKYWGKGRCWKGYEPVPGKKPYSKGSCRKVKKIGGMMEEERENRLRENRLNFYYNLKRFWDWLHNYVDDEFNFYEQMRRSRGGLTRLMVDLYIKNLTLFLSTIREFISIQINVVRSNNNETIYRKCLTFIDGVLDLYYFNNSMLLDDLVNTQEMLNNANEIRNYIENGFSVDTENIGEYIPFFSEVNPAKDEDFENWEREQMEKEDKRFSGRGRKSGAGAGASVNQLTLSIENYLDLMEQELRNNRVNSNNIYTYFYNTNLLINDLVTTNTHQARLEASHLRRRLNHFFRDRIQNNNNIDRFVIAMIGGINRQRMPLTPREDEVEEERRRQREDDERQEMGKEDKRFSGRGRELGLSCV